MYIKFNCIHPRIGPVIPSADGIQASSVYWTLERRRVTSKEDSLLLEISCVPLRFERDGQARSIGTSFGKGEEHNRVVKLPWKQTLATERCILDWCLESSTAESIDSLDQLQMGQTPGSDSLENNERGSRIAGFEENCHRQIIYP
jgi:hypothetical protein